MYLEITFVMDYIFNVMVRHFSIAEIEFLVGKFTINLTTLGLVTPSCHMQLHIDTTVMHSTWYLIGITTLLNSL